MTRTLVAQTLAMLAFGTGLLCGPAQTAAYYVDFQDGADSASGLSPDAAWKHAPGDSRAGPGPRAARLQPGDSVLFRGGVPYRGTVVVRSAGTPDAPIRYVGDAWGPDHAILDGSEPAGRARPCRSASDCGGEAGWAGLVRLSLRSDLSLLDGLFQQDRGLVPAGPGEVLRAGSARTLPGSKGRTVLINPLPGLPTRFATGAGRVGFLLVAGGHVEIRGFRTMRFAPAPRFGPYAGRPLVQLQPLPGVRLVALPGAAGMRHAPPVGPAIAGVTSGPI
jgi:hypothetical protein